MQQRQLRLGDILDDYCPRERRLTNHAVVAMVGEDVKQTRCTTCDTEHEYKHAKVPRQRKKSDTPPALYAQVLAGAPKRVAHEEPAVAVAPPAGGDAIEEIDDAADANPVTGQDADADTGMVAIEAAGDSGDDETGDIEAEEPEREEGPVHRPLIRASLPRQEGQPPQARPAPDFTIRQPGGGRPGRFRPRHQRGGAGQPFQGNRNGNTGGGSMRGGPPRLGGGRPPHGAMSSRPGRPHGPGRKRSK
jgi:hypothetical protein